MSKKKFEFLVICVFFSSLLYVPSLVCTASECFTGTWYFIWELGLSYRVDMVRLAIQSVIVAGILFAVWRFRFKD